MLAWDWFRHKCLMGPVVGGRPCCGAARSRQQPSNPESPRPFTQSPKNSPPSLPLLDPFHLKFPPSPVLLLWSRHHVEFQEASIRKTARRQSRQCVPFHRSTHLRRQGPLRPKL